VASGVPQTLASSVDVTTLEGVKQTLVLGPVASQEAIKMLGTNGGGFFNANSAHPFENPTALTNLVQMLSIFAIGAGLTYCFGKAVGNVRQGWAILAAMMILFLAGAGITYWQEAAGNPVLHQLGVAGGNMEARKCASASPPARCSRWSPRPRRAARSTPCMTASPRWAA
jgi:K+-transporting ATPase ATPase A chain